MINTSLPATPIFHLGPIPLTDAFLGAFIVMILLVVVFWKVGKKFGVIPTRFQVVFEMLTEYVFEQLENAFGNKKKAQDFFPFFMTLLLFILVANQLTLVPFLFQITYGGQALLRQPTSDFALPITFALMIFLISNAMAFKISPIKHLSNFIAIGPLLKARSVMDIFNAIIGFGIGFLNIIGEFAKVVSLASRLFGNVFAGNIMIAVIMALSAYSQFLAPLPFIFLSTFSGLVQAFVFMLLSIQFIALAIDGAQPDAPPAEEEVFAT